MNGLKSRANISKFETFAFSDRLSDVLVHLQYPRGDFGAVPNRDRVKHIIYVRESSTWSFGMALLV